LFERIWDVAVMPRAPQLPIADGLMSHDDVVIVEVEKNKETGAPQTKQDEMIKWLAFDRLDPMLDEDVPCRCLQQ